MRALPTLLLAGLIAPAALSQEFTPTIRFLGDLRIRAEVDGRDFDLSTAPNGFTTMRTRVGLEALPAVNVRVFVMARDARVFGAETDAGGMFNTISDGKSLDLYQGYVELKGFPWDRVTLRAGRQELSYANERMVGAVGWSNLGRVFDGALLRLDLDAVSADLFATTVAEVQPYPAAATPAATAPVPDNGQNFFGLQARWKNTGRHRVDTYLLYQGNRLQTSSGYIDFRRATAGAYASGATGALIYEAEGAWQGGERGDADISAFMLAGTAGWSFAGSALTEVAAGCEYLSGTGAGETGYRSFDPPFGTGHKFHGAMDYFTNIPLHTAGLGLIDLLGRANIRSGDLAASATYHMFRSAEDAGPDDLLGHELDLAATWRYAPALTFEAGVSAFLPGAPMRARFGGADAGIWCYLATAAAF